MRQNILTYLICIVISFGVLQTPASYAASDCPTLRPASYSLNSKRALRAGLENSPDTVIRDIIESKTVNIPMPESISVLQRNVDLRVHKSVIDKIHEDDIKGIQEFVMRNRAVVKDERTDVYALKHPFRVKWGDMELVIIDVYAKGVIFDANEDLLPYHGMGYARKKMVCGADGFIKVVNGFIQPQGACYFREAQREFVLTDLVYFSEYFQKNKIITRYPIGIGRFTGSDKYHMDKDQTPLELGFMLFGCNGFQNFRFTKQIFQETDVLVAALTSAAKMLRLMHEHGISHPWFHLGNFFTAESFSCVHDLGDSGCMQIENIGRDKFIAQILIDLYYAANKLEEDQPMAGEVFLSEYFDGLVRTNTESFMSVLANIIKKSMTIPASYIDHPLIAFLLNKEKQSSKAGRMVSGKKHISSRHIGACA